jgi:predicted peptidase
MPICGGGEMPQRLAQEGAPHPFGTLEERVQRLATVPIWAFHGADDTTVPPERSREMVELVRAAGGDVRYTEFPETSHNSWDQAYDMEQALRWMFDQRRGE